ncbi:MAG: urease accessory protein UreE [Casimicrobiaceae bacterium]
MLTLRQCVAAPDHVDATLVLPFEMRQKSRWATQLSSGEAVALLLPRGTVMRSGNCLAADDGRIVRVVAADEALMEARCASADDLARCAYHLGNRHTPVQVGACFVRFTRDDVLASMLRGLGASVNELSAPFEPEAGAYAGGHRHQTEDAAHRGIIHDMIDRAGQTK